MHMSLEKKKIGLIYRIFNDKIDYKEILMKISGVYKLTFASLNTTRSIVLTHVSQTSLGGHDAISSIRIGRAGARDRNHIVELKFAFGSVVVGLAGAYDRVVHGYASTAVETCVARAQSRYDHALFYVVAVEAVLAVVAKAPIAVCC